MDHDSGVPGDDAVGKMGRVSVPISEGVPGEVIIQIRGGSEAYTAYTDGDEPLAVNSRVVVVEQLSSRTLLVTSC
jgi:membrane protein implicated in regulation of membrane protease activity